MTKTGTLRPKTARQNRSGDERLASSHDFIAKLLAKPKFVTGKDVGDHRWESEVGRALGRVPNERDIPRRNTQVEAGTLVPHLTNAGKSFIHARDLSRALGVLESALTLTTQGTMGFKSEHDRVVCRVNALSGMGEYHRQRNEMESAGTPFCLLPLFFAFSFSFSSYFATIFSNLD